MIYIKKREINIGENLNMEVQQKQQRTWTLQTLIFRMQMFGKTSLESHAVQSMRNKNTSICRFVFCKQQARQLTVMRYLKQNQHFMLSAYFYNASVSLFPVRAVSCHVDMTSLPELTSMTFNQKQENI